MPATQAPAPAPAPAAEPEVSSKVYKEKMSLLSFQALRRKVGAHGRVIEFETLGSTRKDFAEAAFDLLSSIQMERIAIAALQVKALESEKGSFYDEGGEEDEEDNELNNELYQDLERALSIRQAYLQTSALEEYTEMLSTRDRLSGQNTEESERTTKVREFKEMVELLCSDDSLAKSYIFDQIPVLQNNHIPHLETAKYLKVAQTHLEAEFLALILCQTTDADAGSDSALLEGCIKAFNEVLSCREEAARGMHSYMDQLNYTKIGTTVGAQGQTIVLDVSKPKPTAVVNHMKQLMQGMAGLGARSAVKRVESVAKLVNAPSATPAHTVTESAKPPAGLAQNGNGFWSNFAVVPGCGGCASNDALTTRQIDVQVVGVETALFTMIGMQVGGDVLEETQDPISEQLKNDDTRRSFLSDFYIGASYQRQYEAAKKSTDKKDTVKDTFARRNADVKGRLSKTQEDMADKYPASFVHLSSGNGDEAVSRDPTAICILSLSKDKIDDAAAKLSSEAAEEQQVKTQRPSGR